MEFQRIREAVREMIQRLFVRDGALLVINGSERSICHRLAVQAESLFEGWHVDCEYNRDGHDDPKLMDSLRPNIVDRDDSVFPDIVIHRRTLQYWDNNLLVIEVKKSTGRRSRICDLKKLRIFTTDFGRREMNYHYRLGLFLRLTTWRKVPAHGLFRARCDWFSDGKPLDNSDVVSRRFNVTRDERGITAIAD